MFLEKRVTIRTGIMSTVQHDLAHEAFAKGLISKGVHRTVTDSRNNWTVDARTDAFLEELESKIRLDCTALKIFVDVLMESDAAYYDALIRTIRNYNYVLILQNSHTVNHDIYVALN